MTAHQNIAKGFTKGDKVEVEKLWSELEVELNAAGPPIKDVASWKKAWIDWKANVKKKLSHNKNEVRSTGGGQFNQYVLTKADQDVANLCSLYTFVNGFHNSVSCGVNKNQENVQTKPVFSPPSPSASTSSLPPPPTSPNTTQSHTRKGTLSLNDLMEKENIHLEEIGKEFAKLNNTNHIVGKAVENMNEKLDKILNYQKEILDIKKEKLEQFKIRSQEAKRHYEAIEMHNIELRKNKARKIELQVKILELEREKLEAM